MSDFTVVYFNAINRGFSIPSTLCEFSIGSMDFSIKWYGVLIAIGYLVALVTCTKLAKRANIDVDALYDAIIWGTVAAIIGARAYYVLFNLSYYLANPSHILNISEGGLAIYGGIIGAVLAAIIVCKIKKLPLLDALDLAAVGFLAGQGIGRWGNFTNQEAFGKNTSLPWGMLSSKTTEYLTEHKDFIESHNMTVDPSAAVHPTFLYESIWCLLGFVLLALMFVKCRKFKGQIVLSYGIWYGTERAIIESLRTDSLYIPNTDIRISQIISIALAVVCLVLLIVNLKKNKSEKIVEEEKIDEQEIEDEKGTA